MTYLEAINRVLRAEGVIRGDDDDTTSLTTTQHAATSSLAQIAIQSQLADLVANDCISYEDATATVTTTNLTRSYALETDFQRMQELFIEQLDSGSPSGTRILHYRGGEAQLRKDYPHYREETGTPIWFYLPKGTTKQIAFAPVPSDTVSYRYYYEADISVTEATNIIPFVSEIEAQTFVRMAARHFKYLKASREVREQLFPNGIENDPVINHSRSTLMNLLQGVPPRRHYGKRNA